MKTDKCRVCGAPVEHKLTYSNPSLECIKYLKASLKGEEYITQFYKEFIFELREEKERLESKYNPLGFKF